MDLCTIIGVGVVLRSIKNKGKYLMVSLSISGGAYGKKEIE